MLDFEYESASSEIVSGPKVEGTAWMLRTGVDINPLDAWAGLAKVASTAKMAMVANLKIVTAGTRRVWRGRDSLQESNTRVIIISFVVGEFRVNIR
jgi:hypothetical protein